MTARRRQPSCPQGEAEDAGRRELASKSGTRRSLSAPATSTVRVTLPTHLRTLARVSGEVMVEVDGPVTARAVLDRLEADHPVLRGTIREHGGGQRRAFVRFYADGRDLSHDDQDAPLPPAVATGDEPFMVVGAMAGG